MIGPLRKHPRNFGVVEPGAIYRSAALSPRTLRYITTRYALRTIIDLGATTLTPKPEAAIRKAANDLGVQRFALRLKGTGEGDPNEYVRALRILADTSYHPVLVHCGAGAQRTSACIIFYRHVIQDMPIGRAYPESFRFRHHPRKHPQLLTYINQWCTDIALSYHTKEPIPYTGPTARQIGRTPIDQLP